MCASVGVFASVCTPLGERPEDMLKQINAYWCVEFTRGSSSQVNSATWSSVASICLDDRRISEIDVEDFSHPPLYFLRQVRGHLRWKPHHTCPAEPSTTSADEIFSASPALAKNGRDREPQVGVITSPSIHRASDTRSSLREKETLMHTHIPLSAPPHTAFTPRVVSAVIQR